MKKLKVKKKKCDLDFSLEPIVGIFQSGKYPHQDEQMFWKMLEDREIWLESEVNWDNCAFIVQYIQYLNRREADDMTPIKLHIQSNGGDLYVMFSIYDTIKKSKIPVYTINEGAAHSAAFIIFLAGERRTMNKHAYFVAHEGSGGTGGTFRETKAAMQQYEIDVAKMAQIIADETNLTVEEVNQHYDQTSDWYIRYEDAEKFGIIKE